MLSLLCLSAVALCTGCSSHVLPTELEVKETTKESSVDDFVRDNFQTFVEKYNETHVEPLLAKELKRIRPLTFSDQRAGYYFDFDTGFMVAGENYETLAVSNIDPDFEDLLFETEGRVTYTGSSFWSEDGREFRPKEEDIPLSGPAMIGESVTSTNSPDGQITNDKIGSYIVANYPGYSVVSQNYIPSYDYISQFDTSIYVKNEDGSVYSEGNCAINSTFSMLHNMGKKKWNKRFCSEDYYIDYSGDKLIHDVHYTLRNHVDGWQPNPFDRSGAPYGGRSVLGNMSNLYRQLRERAISAYGYMEDGMSGSDSKNMAMDLSRRYIYNSTFLDTSSFELVASLVGDGIPSVVCTSGSVTYGNHAMAVNGYIKLEKTAKWGAFTSTDTKWILAVDDGWQSSCVDGGSDKRRFYDPNKQGGAEFVCANKASLEFSLC